MIISELVDKNQLPKLDIKLGDTIFIDTVQMKCIERIQKLWNNGSNINHEYHMVPRDPETSDFPR